MTTQMPRYVLSTAFTLRKFLQHIESARPFSSTSRVVPSQRTLTPNAHYIRTVSTIKEEAGQQTTSCDDLEDLRPGPSMLKRIVNDLKSVGTTFILPSNDSEAVEQLAQPLKSLVSIGVKPEFVIDACVKNPDLFRNLTTKGESSWQILNILVESCALTYEDSIRMFASYGDELLNCSPSGVQSRIDVLVACGLPAGKTCGRIVRKCPALLFAREPKEMSCVVEALCGFFSRKEFVAIAQSVPEVFLKNIEELEEKYEYIFFQMCIEGEEFKECTEWAAMSLEDIMTRHEFLLKTGRYSTPDPKHPQKKMENPRLHRILDSSEDNFATESIYNALAPDRLPLSDGHVAHGSNTSAANAAATTVTSSPAMTMENRLSLDAAGLVDRAMSINEHLQSMPMPVTDWSEQQFRSQERVDMLSMSSTSHAPMQVPSLPCQLRNVIVSRCDGTVASSSDVSSSSCSPSSSENHQQPPLKCSNEGALATTVATILNHALKPEPTETDFPAESNGSSNHMLMQSMQQRIGGSFDGQCSGGSGASGTLSSASGSSTPASVRRSRSSHDGMLKCQFCPKKWADQNALHTHMADCRLLRGHECAQCGKRFKARGGLQQHLRIHSNDRPYACHFCTKRFTQKSHVDQHERIHTGAKPFTCQFCGRAFRQRSQQLGHEATHANAMSNNNSTLVQASSSQQPRPPNAATSPHQQQQQQQESSRNENPNVLMHELQPPSSSSSSSPLTTSNHLSLLALGQVAPPCTNSAVSSLLALSQNPSTTTPASPPTTYPPFAASNHLQQAAIGLLNGLH